jgi:serine protease Do
MLRSIRGEIIGINVAIYSPDKQNPGFQGVGFSIPSNDVHEALLQILKRGRRVSGFLGVQMRDLDSSMRQATGYDGSYGAVVIEVMQGSPAQEAGLQIGDVVRAINGTSIKTYSELFDIIQRTHIGDVVSLDVWRKGESLTLKATIRESGTTSLLPVAPKSAQKDSSRDLEQILRAIGMQVRDLSVPERMRGYRGVVVTAIADHTLAAGLLKPGDLVMRINGAPIRGAIEFFQNLADSAAVQETILDIYRDGKMQRVNLLMVPLEK